MQITPQQGFRAGPKDSFVSRPAAAGGSEGLLCEQRQIRFKGAAFILNMQTGFCQGYSNCTETVHYEYRYEILMHSKSARCGGCACEEKDRKK